MKRFIKTVGCVTALILIAGLFGLPFISSQTAIAQDKVFKWKLQSHLPTSSTSWEGAVLPVCKLLKERTKGRLIVEPYPAGSLVPWNEIFNALSRGMFQMGSASPGYFSNRVALGGIAVGLPYSFKTYAEATYFHKYLGFDDMIRKDCRKHGVYYSNLIVHPSEFACKKPVRNFEDFKGLKLRAIGSAQKVLAKAGAAASFIRGPEIYPSLASGVIDGAYWGAAQGASSMAFYEVAKYHLKPAITLAGTTVWLASQKAIDQLPEDMQQIFYQTLDEYGLQYTAAYEVRESLALAEAVKKHGVQVVWLTEEAQKKMTEIAMEIWDEEAKKGPECAEALKILKDFLKDLGYI